MQKVAINLLYTSLYYFIVLAWHQVQKVIFKKADPQILVATQEWLAPPLVRSVAGLQYAGKLGAHRKGCSSLE